jgi:hypothetical protein
MSAKRLAVLLVPFLLLVSGAFAQVNELSATVGVTFVSTQTVPSTGFPIHFGNASGTVVADYARLLMTRKIFGLYAELPVAIVAPMYLNYYYATVPKDVSALFVTPSVRLNIFSADSVTPWVSVGGGYGLLRPSSNLEYNNGPNPGSNSNSGVLQFGAGLDVWVWHSWGFRFEARDFYSGNPDLNVVTGRSRQHNYNVGAGVGYRF